MHRESGRCEGHVRWAMNLGSRGAYKTKSSQIESEILALARAVEEIEPRVILELGTARGGTLLLWSQLASELVVSCDIQARRGLHEIAESFPPPDSACRVDLVVGNSHSPEVEDEIRRLLLGRPIDFLFIDGDHSEAGVEADFLRYGRWVRPGGAIAFHDIARHQPDPETRVHEFWRRVRASCESLEWIEDPNQCGFGIGLLRLPKSADFDFEAAVG